MNKIIAELKKAKKIVVLTHRDPDGDAIGSMLATYLVLKKMGKKVDMFCADKVPDIYRFLPCSNKISTTLKSGYDTAVFVDCGGIDRVKKQVEKGKTAKTLVNIDHHPDNTRFGDINHIESISSVSELLYKLFVKMKVKVTKDIATCLYAGIITDTGNFKYDQTTAETFDVAKELIKAGVKTSYVAMHIYENKTLASIKILGAAMYGLRSSKSGKVVWSVLTRSDMISTGAKDEDLTGVVDMLRSIKGVEVAILMREEDYGIKVNFRSKYKINVSAIAGKLGGGGHIRASGALMKTSLEATKNKVLKEVFRVIK